MSNVRSLIEMLISILISIWRIYQGDGDVQTIHFNRDKTVAYLNLVSKTGNEGKTFDDNHDNPRKGNEDLFNGAWSVYPFFKSGNLIVSDINEGLFVLKVNSL